MPRPHKALAAVATFGAMAACFAAAAPPALAAPTCPLSSGQTDTAKSNKLFLYFPTVADATFPAFTANVSPAASFDVADLNPAIGTTAALRNRIHDIVVDDYCEFNVQALKTTTNPDQLPSPPARRVNVAIGSDKHPTSTWGVAPGDVGDNSDVDPARVWGGSYVDCEGGIGMPSNVCSMTGALTGANATVERWAQAIGGTAAHEAGHTYGLLHTDDNPPGDLGGQPGPAPLPGEDSYHRHLMPNGYNLSGEDRAAYRRHFSDRTFGLLASNVGLSVQTMHNWDLVNPNAAAGVASCGSTSSARRPSAPPISWDWKGATSPWIKPVVSGAVGQRLVQRARTYKRYRITWSTANPVVDRQPRASSRAAGTFHVGATFTGVDFNAPDPIIIQNITLLDASCEAADAASAAAVVRRGNPPTRATTRSRSTSRRLPAVPNLQLENATICELPRVASIESMMGAGRPVTFDDERIRPWATRKLRRPPRHRPQAARQRAASSRS